MCQVKESGCFAQVSHRDEEEEGPTGREGGREEGKEKGRKIGNAGICQLL